MSTLDYQLGKAIKKKWELQPASKIKFFFCVSSVKATPGS